jgi:hypothetical protein
MQPAPDNAQLGQQVLKLGTHRNNRRIWLDNSPMLTAAGFFPGLKYRADFIDGILNARHDYNPKIYIDIEEDAQ